MTLSSRLKCSLLFEYETISDSVGWYVPRLASMNWYVPRLASMKLSVTPWAGTFHVWQV